jgi:hypothetical protein
MLTQTVMVALERKRPEISVNIVPLKVDSQEAV